MTEPITDKLLEFVKESESHYHRLVLLVGPPGCGKTSVLNIMAKKVGKDIININLELSERLLEMASKKRPLKVSGLLDDILGPNQKIVILDNNEILFDFNLKQNPLALLQQASRNRTIIASWCGKTDGGKLIYAEPGHAEYQTYNTTDILMVHMNKKIG